MMSEENPTESSSSNEIKFAEWLKQAWEIIKPEMVDFALAALIVGAILAISLPCVIPLLILAGPMGAGMIYFIRKKYHGEATKVSDLFVPLQTQFFDTFVVGICILLAMIVVGSVVSFALMMIPVLGPIVSIVLNMVIGGAGAVIMTAAMIAVLDKKKLGFDAVKYGFAFFMRDPMNFTLYGALCALIKSIGFALCILPVLITGPLSVLALVIMVETLEGIEGPPPPAAAATGEQPDSSASPPAE